MDADGTIHPPVEEAPAPRGRSHSPVVVGVASAPPSDPFGTAGTQPALLREAAV